MDKFGLFLRIIGCILMYLGVVCSLKIFGRVWWFHVCICGIITVVLCFIDKLLDL